MRFVAPMPEQRCISVRSPESDIKNFHDRTWGTLTVLMMKTFYMDLLRCFRNTLSWSPFVLAWVQQTSIFGSSDQWLYLQHVKLIQSLAINQVHLHPKIIVRITVLSYLPMLFIQAFALSSTRITRAQDGFICLPDGSQTGSRCHEWHRKCLPDGTASVSNRQVPDARNDTEYAYQMAPPAWVIDRFQMALPVWAIDRFQMPWMTQNMLTRWHCQCEQ